jgi:hypothetical protein
VVSARDDDESPTRIDGGGNPVRDSARDGGRRPARHWKRRQRRPGVLGARVRRARAQTARDGCGLESCVAYSGGRNGSAAWAMRPTTQPTTCGQRWWWRSDRRRALVRVAEG